MLKEQAGGWLSLSLSAGNESLYSRPLHISNMQLHALPTTPPTSLKPQSTGPLRSASASDRGAASLLPRRGGSLSGVGLRSTPVGPRGAAVRPQAPEGGGAGACREWQVDAVRTAGSQVGLSLVAGWLGKVVW